MYILYSWQIIKRRRKKRSKEEFTTYKVFKNKKCRKNEVCIIVI
jgi:hypothetical protein